MTDQTTTPLVCANHPNRETGLRCNRCEKLICPECAVLTPTGYRCRECVRDQQKIFETAEWYDYPLAVAIGAGFSFLGSILIGQLGFFAIFLAPVAGIVIAEVVRAVVRRRRGRRLYLITVGAVVLGALPIALQTLFFAIGGSFSGGGLFAFFPLLWQGYYLFIVPSTVYTRLSGIQLRR